MKSSLFVIYVFADVVVVVVYCSHPMKPLFYSEVGEFVVIIKLYIAWIDALETSLEGEFVGIGSYGIIGKFFKR